jgi:hypothetical protein
MYLTRKGDAADWVIVSVQGVRRDQVNDNWDKKHKRRVHL